MENKESVRPIMPAAHKIKTNTLSPVQGLFLLTSLFLLAMLELGKCLINLLELITWGLNL